MFQSLDLNPLAYEGTQAFVIVLHAHLNREVCVLVAFLFYTVVRVQLPRTYDTLTLH